jgi:carbon monoxide dehydrogenase subunit G
MREYQGTVSVAAPAHRTFAFVSSAEQVGPCMPDLLGLTVRAPEQFEAKVRVGVGPVRGTFVLNATIFPDAAGTGARLQVRGGGLGNGVTIDSQLSLAERGERETDLEWHAQVSVSGPLAALGGRVIDGQASRIAAALFENIRHALEDPGAAG